MELKLKRIDYTQESTIGELFVNGKFECFTLEDVERKDKIYGKTAIPKGIYQVIISFSPRFKTYMPLLLNVPNFLGVRIHTGNNAKNTEGCILVGKSKGKDVISNSRMAYNSLLEKLKIAEKKEKIILTIE